MNNERPPANEADLEPNEFEVIIEFRASEGDPSRVFKSMSGLVDSLSLLDRHLISMVDTALVANLVLDEVSAGSLKAKFKSVIEDIPDEALKNVEWKSIIGHFLLKAKYLIVNWCSKREAIKSRDDVMTLEGELMEAAEEADVKALPAYASIGPEQLLGDIRHVQNALEYLDVDDSAIYRSRAGRARFNRKLVLSDDMVQAVLTRDVLNSERIRILKVKKPDYLGKSMWVFQHEHHAIDAAVLDTHWVTRFQAREIDVRPGDSLKVQVKERVSYGYKGEVVHRHYEITSVIEVIHNTRLSQDKLFRDES